MAKLSKALSLTCQSFTTARVRIPAGACENVAIDLGLGGGLSWVIQFSPLLTNYFWQVLIHLK